MPGPSATRYFHKDHLGSLAVITDEAGTVFERLAYDFWGKRHHPNGADDPSKTITSYLTAIARPPASRGRGGLPGGDKSLVLKRRNACSSQERSLIFCAEVSVPRSLTGP